MGATSTDPDTAEARMADNDQEGQDSLGPMLMGDDDDDDAPQFVTAEDAVEVQVDEDNVPMDDDDDDQEDGQAEANAQDTEMGAPAQDTITNVVVVPDMSLIQLQSHSGPVYAVQAFVDPEQQQNVSIVTGGGDDKAFLHKLVLSTAAQETAATTSGTTTTVESADSKHLEYAHTDSVSAVAFNLPFLAADAAPESNKKRSSSNETTRLIAVGAYDGAIALYNADTGALVRTLEGPSDVECVAWHHKGGTVLLAGSAADGTLWLYHIPLQKVLQVFVGHEAGISACEFSTDGKWAISGSADGTVRLWAPRTGACKHVFRFGTAGSDEPAAGITCLAVGGGADGQLLVAGAEDGTAHVCHVGTKKVVATLRHVDGDATTQQRTDADQNMEGDDDDEEEQVLPLSVEAVGFSPSHPQWCATGGVDGVLKIWDLAVGAQGTCRQVCRRPQQQQQQQEANDNADSSSAEAAAGGITRLSWHPTLPLVFTSTTSGTVDLWDARNGQLLQSLTQGSSSSSNAVLNDLDIQYLSRDGSAVVVTACDDETVRVFHVNVQQLWNNNANNASATGQ